MNMTVNPTESPVLPAAAADKYEIVSCVKKSKSSSSYIACDKEFKRNAFLKIGAPYFVGNEARMLEQLKGKGIPEVYDFFEQDGVCYLFRSYIEGENLHEHIKNNGAFSLEKTVRTGIDVCEILSRMHEKNPPIIHRDIKSENIVITPNGEIYLVDFGISREYDFNASRDTQVMGTPAAAPPEQFGYGQTDERSDVYAVGVLLNELATCSVKINTNSLPKKLSAIIKRCTEFAPEKRYKNAAECKKALLKIQKKTMPAIAATASAACIACLAAIFLVALNTNKNNNDPPENITEASVSETSDTEDTENTESTANSGGKQLIEFNGGYVGDWEYGCSIPKSMLEGFDGDAKITLEIETVEEGKDGSRPMLVPVNSENRWEKLTVFSIDERASDGMWIMVGKGRTSCTFTMSRDVIDTLGDSGFDFQIYNLIIKSAVIEEASYEEVKYEITDTKTPYTIQLDNEYQGDYSLGGAIPKSVLENYKGDVKVTFDIEVGGRYNYANFLPIALVGEEAEWHELFDEVGCEYIKNADGFIEMNKDQTECTLIISHEAVEMCGRYGIGFMSINVTFKSATLCDADE